MKFHRIMEYHNQAQRISLDLLLQSKDSNTSFSRGYEWPSNSGSIDRWKSWNIDPPLCINISTISFSITSNSSSLAVFITAPPIANIFFILILHISIFKIIRWFFSKSFFYFFDCVLSFLGDLESTDSTTTSVSVPPWIRLWMYPPASFSNWLKHSHESFPFIDIHS